MTVKEQNIKKDFEIHFRKKMNEENMTSFFDKIFAIGTAYVVGGFFRDFLTNKESRDIDVIVDMPDQKLKEIVEESSLTYTKNRQGGIKIKLNKIDLDIWSMENNWAFKYNLVKLNENDKLNSIAKGCFYNYDALVINLQDFSYNLRHYKDFENSNKLNIIQAKTNYMNLNPSVEANILRAFYIKNKFNSSFSDTTLLYLTKKLKQIEDNHSNALQKLLDTRQKYPKYDELDASQIEEYMYEVKSDYYENEKQLSFQGVM